MADLGDALGAEYEASLLQNYTTNLYYRFSCILHMFGK